MKRRKHSGTPLMLLGLLLLSGAAALTVFNISRENTAAAETEFILPDLTAAITHTAAELEKTEMQDTIPEEARAVPTVEIDGAQYAGILQIPALGLELPVLNDCSNTNLKKAPCRYTGSVSTDDLVIAAHNYTGHFGRLAELSAGDDVYFYTADGAYHHFAVAYFETLMPNQVDYMTDGEYPLTLFTCTWGGRSRVTVRCEKVG